MNKYLKKNGNTKNISSWKSKGLSNEVIKLPNNTLAPTLDYACNLLYVMFRGSCLKQDKIMFNHRKIVSICIYNQILIILILL